MYTVLLAVMLAAGSPADEPKKPRIAVLDVQTTGIEANIAPVLTEVLTVDAHALGAFDVVAGSDVQAMLGFEHQKDLAGCTDAACLAEIGGALGVDKLLIGSVGRVGHTYVVNIKLVNIRTAQAENRIYEVVKGEQDALLSTMKTAIWRLFPELSKAIAHESAEQTQQGNDATTPGIETSAPTRRTGLLPEILWTGGAAGLVAGTAFIVKAEVHESHANDASFVGAQLEIGKARTSRTVGVVAAGAGGAALAAGLGLWLLSTGAEEKPASALVPIAGEGGARGIAWTASW